MEEWQENTAPEGSCLPQVPTEGGYCLGVGSRGTRLTIGGSQMLRFYERHIRVSRDGGEPIPIANIANIDPVSAGRSVES